MKLFSLAALTWLAVAAAGDSYAQDPNVYELTPSNFNKVVHGSNYTTVVKFYAPWCGYCQKLEPIYHKLARFLHRDGKYAVQVAAVNCDADANKPLCQKHKVQGFPTVMVFRPPKFVRGKTKKAKHVPEVYNGERTLAPMVEFSTSRIKNYVKKFHSIASAQFGKWLLPASDEGLHKVVLVTTLTSISPLLRTLAIDFLDSTVFSAVLAKDYAGSASVEVDGEEVALPLKEDEQFPVLLVYKPQTREFVRYKGKKLKNKDKIEKWLMDTTGAVPSEGGLSKKEEKHAKYRGVRRPDDEL